jgi:hypothetical protein
MGIVSVINQPTPNAESGLQAITSWLKSIGSPVPTMGDLGAYRFLVGWNSEQFFDGASVEGYELRMVKVAAGQPVAGGAVKVHAERDPKISEAGVSFAIDVNSKPMKRSLHIDQLMKQILDHVRANTETTIERCIKALGGRVPR